MNKLLSPSQTSFYLVLKLIEMKAYRNEKLKFSMWECDTCGNATPVRIVFGATKYHGWRMSGTSYLCVRSTTPFVERFLSRETMYWSTAATLCRGRDVRRGILHPWFGM